MFHTKFQIVHKRRLYLEESGIEPKAFSLMRTRLVSESKTELQLGD